MKEFRSLILVFVTVMFGCESKPQLANDYLIGTWQVSEISAENVTIFGKPFNTSMEDYQQTFEFTSNEMYMYYESTYGSKGDTTRYQFSAIDSILTIDDNGKKEITTLNIINQNEFEIEDNMGVILKVKKASKK